MDTNTNTPHNTDNMYVIFDKATKEYHKNCNDVVIKYHSLREAVRAVITRPDQSLFKIVTILPLVDYQQETGDMK